MTADPQPGAAARVFFPTATATVEAALRERLGADAAFVGFGEVLPSPAEFQLLIAGRPTEEQLLASSRLETLLIPFAGVPKTTSEILTRHPEIAVHNLHHNAAPTAEMAMALLLAAAKEVIPLDAKLRRGDWRPRYEMSAGTLLEGKTVVILGYGAIGRRVAALCRAFGMSVVAVRRRWSDAEKHSACAAGVEPAEVSPLIDLYPRAHALVVALPLTPETEGLVDGAALGALPDGAVVVNVGRAAIIQEEPFHAELASGRICAGINVWYRYPDTEAEREGTLPSEYPFHELENVVLSPHRAGHTEAVDGLRADHLAGAIRLFLAGEAIPHAVDLTLGY